MCCFYPSKSSRSLEPYRLSYAMDQFVHERKEKNAKNPPKLPSILSETYPFKKRTLSLSQVIQKSQRSLFFLGQESTHAQFLRIDAGLKILEDDLKQNQCEGVFLISYLKRWRTKQQLKKIARIRKKILLNCHFKIPQDPRQEPESFSIRLKAIFNSLKDRLRKPISQEVVELCHTYSSSIYKLIKKPGSFLSNVDVDHYCKWLQKIYANDKKTSLILSEGVHRSRKRLAKTSALNQWNKHNLDSLECNQPSLILMPFVFPKKRFYQRDHIVLIAINTQKKQIFYYDPQGKCADHPQRLHCFEDAPDFNMKEELKRMAKKKLGIDDELLDQSILENPYRNQNDVHNCGVYVLNAMEKILQGYCFEDIIFERLQREDLLKIRLEMGRKLNQEALIERSREKLEITEGIYFNSLDNGWVI